jgi:CRISPR system Cascade subunit CasA
VAFDWPRADFYAASREFAIGLLSTVFWREARPGERTAWRELWQKPPAASELRERFAPYATCFWLDGDGPRFMQDRDELPGNDVPVERLLIDSPGEDTIRRNLDVFVKRGRIGRLSRSSAAMALFTLQTYAPEGGRGHRTSLRGGGPFTTLVMPPGFSEDRPASLWHQLWTNVFWGETWPDPEADRGRVFPWLSPVRTSTRGEITTPLDVHPAQVYWGMPRRIRLDFGKNTTGDPCDLTGEVDAILVRTYRTRPHGINYEGWSRAHPLSPYYRARTDSPEWLPLHPQPGRMAYRDWVGLVVADSAEETGSLRQPAAILRVAEARLRRSDRQPLVLATGYDMDHKEARGFVESLVPLLVFDEDIREPAEDAVRLAIAGSREAEALLSEAVADALHGHDRPKDEQGERAVVRHLFWERTEGDFVAHVENIRTSLTAAADGGDVENAVVELSRKWHGFLRRTCRNLFDERVPLELTEIGNAERIVRVRRELLLQLDGRNRGRHRLFEALRLPPPAPASKRRQAA